MVHDLSVPVFNYAGEPFKRDADTQMLLKDFLEVACLSANPQEFNTGEKKHQVYSLLIKVHEAKPLVELSAEEVALLKKLCGHALVVAAYGAVEQLLENPTRTRTVKEPDVPAPLS